MGILDDLEKVELFRDFDERDLDRVAKSAVIRTFEAGDVIIREGESYVAFYIVRSGQVDAVKDYGGPHQLQLNTHGPGDYFGEVGLLADEGAAASMVAVEDTNCLVLTKWDFQAELNEPGSKLAQILLLALAKRVSHYMHSAQAPRHDVPWPLRALKRG